MSFKGGPFSRPHDYTTRNTVYTPPEDEAPEVSDDKVFKALQKHSTPFNKAPATEDGSEFSLPILGKVKTTSHRDSLSVDNDTTPEHLLHEGNVHRSVERGDDRSYSIRTHGTGTGPFPRLNELFSGPLWRYTDKKIAYELDPTLKARETEEMLRKMRERFEDPDA